MKKIANGMTTDNLDGNHYTFFKLVKNFSNQVSFTVQLIQNE